MRTSFFIKRNKIKFILLSAVLLGSCDFDQGLGPLQTRLSGRIVYLSPSLRPNDVDEVRVAALLKFPPTGLGDVFFSEPLNYRNDTTYFDLPLPKGDYPAVVLLWKAKNESWSFNSLLGVYGFEPPLQFELRSVSVTPEKPVVDDVNLTALWNFAQSDSRIAGEIRYRGTLPADTEAILLAAFSQMPQFDNFLVSLLFLGGLPLPVSAADEVSQYQLRVNHDDYKFVGLFWKGVNTPIQEMKLIGFYRDPTDDSQPGEVVAPEDGIIRNIDFVADFTTLPDGIRP